MKNYFILFLLLIVLISCESKNEISIYQKIKEYEFSRNPDTTFYSGLLTSSDDQVILSIAQSIGRIANESYLPLLELLLSSTNTEIKKEALFSIGQIGTPHCEKLLLNLFEHPEFAKFQNDLILALGKCAGKPGSIYLLKNLQSVNDSLKTLIIQNLSYIFKRNNKLKTIPDSINNYLNHNSSSVRNAALYFFHRNTFKPAYYNLLNVGNSSSSIGYKYQLSALSKILENHYSDSLMLDSLKTIFMSKKFYKEPEWQKLIYKIKILAHYPDSLNTIKIATYLSNENPHVRKAAIQALGKNDTGLTKNKLLHYYDKTNWSEKGLIILNLAKRYPELIYMLIQQNLDLGTLYFKELLLQALAKINNRSSRTQLKQFLNVPEPRLQATVFNELDKLRRLSYKDVQTFLLSGNEMLASFGAYWIIEHPKYGKYEDLISAYSMFSEPKNIETMVTIIEAINKLKDKKSISFLDSTYIKTQHPDIAKIAAEGLSQFDIGSQERVFSEYSIFIPDSMIYDFDPISVTIKTKKGDIEIELWPKDAPLTVSHFIYLIKNEFYKNLLFHRVVSDFVIQGGDPSGTGWGGPGYAIPCEYNNNPYIRGSVGLATAGKDTGSSQFFICHSEQPHLNRRYTNFGVVKKGMDVVDKITKDDKIIDIIINQ